MSVDPSNLNSLLSRPVNQRVVYDPSLESEMADPSNLDSLLSRPVNFKERQTFSPSVKKYLKQFLTRVKNFQDVEFNPDAADGADKEKAFIQTLYIMKKWIDYGDEAQVGELRASVKHIHEKFRTAKVLIWVETDVGKYYYTLKFLDDNMNIQKIESILTGVEEHYDGYDGLMPNYDEDGNIKIPKKLGITFFQFNSDQNLRKVPANGIHNEEEVKIKFPGARVARGAKLQKYGAIRRYSHPVGAFFPYVATINIDLSPYQIFTEIKAKNYKHNCFVYACIQSQIFTKQEIEYMCGLILTRNIPRKDIKKIAKELKVNIVIRTIDESRDVRHQMLCDCDTRKILKETFDRTLELYLYKDHYFVNKPLPITPFFIKNYEAIQEAYPDMKLSDQQRLTRIGVNKPTFTDKLTNPMKILRTMFECNRFRHINKGENDIIKTNEYENKHLNDYEELDYDANLCTRPIEDSKREKNYDHIYYADFESDTSVSPHKAYMCCLVKLKDDEMKHKSFIGNDCALQFLNYLPDNSLIYFHNLKYDASFFMNLQANEWNVKITERSGNILQLQFTHIFTKRHLTFRNSYSLIPAPLKAFASMFKLDIEKDVCPYGVYTQENLKKKWLPYKDCVEDIKNRVSKTGGSVEDTVKDFQKNLIKLTKEGHQVCMKQNGNILVDIIMYSEYYCIKDCEVLCQGLRAFDKDLCQLFESNGRKWIGIESYISVSAVGYDFAVKYGCLEGCYELGGKPQNFISRCISGGRTMVANNAKLIIDKKIQDFDAVSLYPSAMSIMDGIPKGIPKVLTDNECQFKSFKKYDDYFVEINITKLQAKGVDKYPFPLVWGIENNSKVWRDQCYDHFYVDKRSLMDLEEFYDIEYDVLRGYYFDEGFNKTINKFITQLFNLRKKYKDEGNPLQNTIKLLLNSVYGKSILKPVSTETKVVNPNKFERFVIQYYNYIKCCTESFGDKKHLYAKLIKPINKHFNCPQFGVNVLSWSKHIMNKVMCLAAQNKIEVYYQDTDSMHIDEDKVETLNALYRAKYKQELIGKNLCQFHCDFEPIVEGVPIHSRKLIALGKKSYLDILEDANNATSFHFRMKGIPQAVILNHCKERKWTLEDLYMKLFNGEKITFNLLDGSNCFRKNKYYEQYTPKVFVRTVKF